MAEAVGRDWAAKVDIRPLSLWFRRQYWRRHADEADASVLWPGLRQVLSQRLAGEVSLVTAATTRASPVQVASRSVFTRSRLYPDLWYYGYLLTLPEFRRQGLGERVMQAGLAEIRRAGGRYCSCYVEYGNRASVDLAEKLGLARLPWVRMVVRGAGGGASGEVSLTPARSTDVRQCLAAGMGAAVHNLLGQGAGEAIAADELHVPGSSLPWRSPDSALFWMQMGEKVVGMARVGGHKSVIVPVIDPLDGDVPQLIHAMVVAVSQGERPAFVFLPSAICEEYVRRYAGRDGVSCNVFDIFWGDITKPQGAR